MKLKRNEKLQNAVDRTKIYLKMKWYNKLKVLKNILTCIIILIRRLKM